MLVVAETESQVDIQVDMIQVVLLEEVIQALSLLMQPIIEVAAVEDQEDVMLAETVDQALLS
jgi:hypothetical protein